MVIVFLLVYVDTRGGVGGATAASSIMVEMVGGATNNYGRVCLSGRLDEQAL